MVYAVWTVMLECSGVYMCIIVDDCAVYARKNEKGKIFEVYKFYNR